MDVGGDWYDVVETGRGLALVIGDVQGHGVSAAATMGQLRSAVRAFALSGHDPEEVMSGTNRLLIDLDPGQFASCCYIVLDPATGSAQAVRAGHPQPLLRHPDGRTEVLDLPGGVVLGIDVEASYPVTELRLEPGAVLALYTDGLVEQAGIDIDLGVERLRSSLAEAGSSSLAGTADRLIERGTAGHRPARRHRAAARRPLDGIRHREPAMSSVYGAEHHSVRGPLNATRAATAVLDADGTVVGWSPTAQGLLGYAPQDVLGRPIDTLVMDGTAEDHAAPDAPAMGRVARTLRMRHQDGRALRVTTTELPLAHTGPGPARLLALADAEETEQWEALQSMLRGLATQSPVGLAIYDTDLRVVWTNAALYEEMGPSQYVGLGPDDMVTHGEVLSAAYPKTLEEMMRRVLATGETVVDLHYRGRPPVGPGA